MIQLLHIIVQCYSKLSFFKLYKTFLYQLKDADCLCLHILLPIFYGGRHPPPPPGYSVVTPPPPPPPGYSVVTSCSAADLTLHNSTVRPHKRINMVGPLFSPQPLSLAKYF